MFRMYLNIRGRELTPAAVVAAVVAAVAIFIIVAPGLSLQQHHHHPSDSYSSELDESRLSREYDYDQSPTYHRSSRRHRHKKHTSTEKLASAELEASNDKYTRHYDRRSHRYPKGHLRRYSNSDNCVCDCMKCDDLQQCCQPVCNNECEQPEQTNQVEQTGLSPGNLVFVPYPYPLVVPPPISPLMPLPPLPMVPGPAPDAPNPSITTSTAPSIEQDPESRNGRKQSENEDKDSYVALLRSLRHRKDLPLSRAVLAGMRPVKRYLPEYGTISDHIIDRLISRVRNVKDIHSRI